MEGAPSGLDGPLEFDRLLVEVLEGLLQQLVEPGAGVAMER